MFTVYKIKEMPLFSMVLYPMSVSPDLCLYAYF